ncbi:MAG: hypothetical protein V3W41_04170 [Planctomycetota bacterium]
MSLSSIASSSLNQAYTKLESHASKLVKKGPEVENIIGLKDAEKQAQVALKLLKVDGDLHDSIIDIIV